MIKLVRLQLELPTLADIKLPPGYETIWERYGGQPAGGPHFVELLIKGEFPDSYPDCCPVDCRISVTDTLTHALAWDWLWYPYDAHTPRTVDLHPISFRVSLPN